MNEDEIRELYDRLIDHYAECHEIQKLTRWRPDFVVLDRNDKRSRYFEKTGNVSGAWSSFDDWHPACIEFYGEPSIETVMHELIHHIIFVIDRCDISDEPRIKYPPRPLPTENILSCPKCKSRSVEIEKNNACLCYQCVCKICGHSWIDERMSESK